MPNKDYMDEDIEQMFDDEEDTSDIPTNLEQAARQRAGANIIPAINKRFRAMDAKINRLTGELSSKISTLEDDLEELEQGHKDIKHYIDGNDKDILHEIDMVRRDMKEMREFIESIKRWMSWSVTIVAGGLITSVLSLIGIKP